jgi:transposase
MLEQKAAAEKSAVLRDRYIAVAMALDKQDAPRIARQLRRSRRWVQKWAYRYRDQGVDALVDRPRPGQPTTLPQDKQQAFKARIVAGPVEADDGICTLRGRDAQRILEKEFGVRYALSGTYALMHRIGLSCLMPRPKHQKNDPEAAEKWLTRAPFLSTQKPSVPAKKSASSSRTKPASVNKAR